MELRWNTSSFENDNSSQYDKWVDCSRTVAYAGGGEPPPPQGKREKRKRKRGKMKKKEYKIAENR